MPVRIVFEGLMLFQFPETGPNAGKLVAYLINDDGLAGESNGPEHDHDAEVLILTGEEKGTALVPKILKRGATLDIVVPGQKGAKPSQSFTDHVADLGAIIANGTPAVRNAGRGEPNSLLVQNIVTIDRGLARVQDVTVWDQGGYPLSGDPKDVGTRAGSHAVVKFMGSSIGGHMASKVVVEIDDAQTVKLECDHDNRFNVPKKGSSNPTDPHMPPRTVEIRITNYERPGAKPTPWGLDFQWLFEAAGYEAVDLASPVFEAWVDAASRYDPDLFEEEQSRFLDGPNHTIGRPFPYIESEGSLTSLQPLKPPTPLTNYPKILVCVHAVVYKETTTRPDGTVVTRELRLELAPPRLRAAMKRKALAKKAPAKKTLAKKTPAKTRKAKRPKKR